ncbi:hypothetical protein JXI42_00315 [bacterium]|nr:hypothetical protein [bacterium]
MKILINKYTILLLLLCCLFYNPLLAEDDVIFRAMNDEMQRSLDQLRLEDYGPPYFVGYTIEDHSNYSIKASFGGITESYNSDKRYLMVDVRVGDYSFDNKNYISSNIWGLRRRRHRGITREDDYDALRHTIWYYTDQEYKDAIEEFAKKKASLQTRIIKEEIDDFYEEKPVVYTSEYSEDIFDPEAWEKILANVSSVFKQYPRIYDSRLDFDYRRVTKYILNSEGSRVKLIEPLISLNVHVDTQDEDGVEWKDSWSYYASNFSDFPGEEELYSAVNQRAKEFTDMIFADTIDYYIGPVLFEDEAACEFFYQILGKNLTAPISALTDFDWQENQIPDNQLANKKDKPILPIFISVYDDPVAEEFGGLKLLGSYVIDDECVQAQRVDLVNDGKLENFLMSRRPVKEIEGSNGHGRASLGNAPTPRLGNLFIDSERKTSPKKLRKELINLCKEQKLDYGIIIKKLKDERFSQNSNEGAVSLTEPIYAYKVYTDDGREELLKGVETSNLTILILREILKTSDEEYVLNKFEDGFSGNVPISIVAPSILVRDMEIISSIGKMEKLPILKNPYFEK